MNDVPSKSDMDGEAASAVSRHFHWSNLTANLIGACIILFAILLYAVVVAFFIGMAREILPAVDQAGTDFIEWIFS